MKAALVIAAPLLAACASLAPAAAGPTAGLGGTAHVDGLTVRPIFLIEDSRCPTSVQCVWAGRLLVRVEVRSRDHNEQIDLELGKSQQVSGGDLKLVSAMPARSEATPAMPKDYRFTFEFLPGR